MPGDTRVYNFFFDSNLLSFGPIFKARDIVGPHLSILLEFDPSGALVEVIVLNDFLRRPFFRAFFDSCRTKVELESN